MRNIQEAARSCCRNPVPEPHNVGRFPREQTLLPLLPPSLVRAPLTGEFLPDRRARESGKYGLQASGEPAARTARWRGWWLRSSLPSPLPQLHCQCDEKPAKALIMIRCIRKNRDPRRTSIRFLPLKKGRKIKKKEEEEEQVEGCVWGSRG